jgi:hypothetical protein
VSRSRAAPAGNDGIIPGCRFQIAVRAGGKIGTTVLDCLSGRIFQRHRTSSSIGIRLNAAQAASKAKTRGGWNTERLLDGNVHPTGSQSTYARHFIPLLASVAG